MPLDPVEVQRVKDLQCRHWDNVAGGWASWMAWTERNFQPVTDWLGRHAGWRPGARALDIACGPGYPALAAARAVQPGGRVVACDLSASMIEVASRTAAAFGIENVEYCRMDAEALDFADQSFDAVTNAYGLMFCPDSGQALREARRVLKEGARTALATWAPIEESPYFSVITGIGVARLGLKPPGPDAPGPFRFSSPDVLRQMLEDAGFHDVRVERVSKRFACESVEEYCRMLAELAWKSRVAALSQEEWHRFNAEVARATEPYRTREGLLLPAVSLCASGRR